MYSGRCKRVSVISDWRAASRRCAVCVSAGFNGISRLSLAPVLAAVGLTKKRQAPSGGRSARFHSRQIVGVDVCQGMVARQIAWPWPMRTVALVDPAQQGHVITAWRQQGEFVGEARVRAVRGRCSARGRSCHSHRPAALDDPRRCCRQTASAAASAKNLRPTSDGGGVLARAGMPLASSEVPAAAIR